MKKTYFKPEFKVVKLQSRTRLLVGSGSKVQSVNSGGIFNSTVTASTTEARSRGGWDDEEDF